MYLDGDECKGLPILCAEPDKLEGFINLKGSDGKAVKPADFGVLVREKFLEYEGYEKGDGFKVLDDDLKEHELYITGTYYNPFSQTSVISPQAYKLYLAGSMRSMHSLFKLPV